MPSKEYLGIDKPINKITPLVSVCIPTFQQASFIVECIDSVLSQTGSFPLEILVGEDDSSDGTREICMAYADKFPDKIRLFLNDRADVIFLDGRPTGLANFLNLLSEARGEFIALCDGDDYWTDDSKLERQVSIFQKHPNCSLVFHNSLVVQEGSDTNNFCTNLVEGFYDIENVITKNWFVPTQSILFRKDLLQLGEWFKHVYNTDYAVQLTLATKNQFFYVDRIMSAYRVHNEGISRGRGLFFHPIKLAETLSIFNSISEFKYDQLIKKRLDDLRSLILYEAQHEAQCGKQIEGLKAQHKKTIEDLHNSLSWKVTAPLRAFGRLFVGNKSTSSSPSNP